MISIKTKTWTCPDCGYKQDFEPIKENMVIHFSELELKDSECPACASGKNLSRIVKRGVKIKRETDPAKKMILNIRDTDEEVLEQQKDKFGELVVDKNGKPVMVKQVLKGATPEEVQAIKNKYEDK